MSASDDLYGELDAEDQHTADAEHDEEDRAHVRLVISTFPSIGAKLMKQHFILF